MNTITVGGYIAIGCASLVGIFIVYLFLKHRKHKSDYMKADACMTIANQSNCVLPKFFNLMLPSYHIHYNRKSVGTLMVHTIKYLRTVTEACKFMTKVNAVITNPQEEINDDWMVLWSMIIQGGKELTEELRTNKQNFSEKQRIKIKTAITDYLPFLSAFGSSLTPVLDVNGRLRSDVEMIHHEWFALFNSQV